MSYKPIALAWRKQAQMTMNTLHILLGAGLVMLGVLSGAVADRIRGIRLPRERRDREPVERPLRAARASSSAPAVPTTSAHEAMARDVAAVLITAGYSKPVAAAAVDACIGSECSTLESWTRAALRRAMVRDEKVS